VSEEVQKRILKIVYKSNQKTTTLYRTWFSIWLWFFKIYLLLRLRSV